MKKWIFDDPFDKKLPVLVILVPVMIRLSRSGSYKKLPDPDRGNWALEVVEAKEVAEAAEVNDAGEVSKA